MEQNWKWCGTDAPTDECTDTEALLSSVGGTEPFQAVGIDSAPCVRHVPLGGGAKSVVILIRRVRSLTLYLQTIQLFSSERSEFDSPCRGGRSQVELL